MKIAKGLVTVAMMTSLVTSSLAVPLPVSNAVKQPLNVLQQEQIANCQKQDPLRAIENKKAKIRELVKEGKMTPEEAEEKIAKLDEKIQRINEFKELDLPQKKKSFSLTFSKCWRSVSKKVK